MKIKFKKMKAVLSTLVFMLPQSSLVGAHSGKQLIDDFVESLSIASDAVSIKLPSNMAVVQDDSYVSNNSTDASVLVLESNAHSQEKLTYKHESVNKAGRVGHVAKIEEELRSNYDNVKEHSKKTQRFNYEGVAYHLRQVTFSCVGGEVPTAVTVVSVYDGTQQITVSAQVKHPSLKKAVARSKMLVKKSISTRIDSEGYSIWFYLGIGAALFLVMMHQVAGNIGFGVEKWPSLLGAKPV